MNFKFLVILFTSLTLLFSISLSAQTEKGTLALGLQLENVGRFQGVNLDLNLTGEYFIKDGWSIGAGVGNFYYAKSEDTKNFHIEAFVNTRKYFRNGKKLQPYLGARMGLNYLNYESETYEDVKGLGLSLGIEAGLQYNFNKKLSLTMGIQSNYRMGVQSNSEIWQNQHRITSKAGIKTTLGLKYNFGPRRKKNVAKKIY